MDLWIKLQKIIFTSDVGYKVIIKITLSINILLL